ncbi:MAG: VOC family protein [Anaerolineae bacterium]
MAQAIHPDTRMGAVHLTVADLDRSLAFYQNVMGMAVHGRGPEATGSAGDTRTAARLGAAEEELLVLVEEPAARAYGGTSGLYHFAVLVPSRKELAWSLRRLAETRTPIQGVVDHWISEAIYLSDPDGNGIEIARDRRREAWPPMETLAARGNGPVDLEGLFAELDARDGTWPGLDRGTTIGHVHLHVADLEQAEGFYHGALGFDIMARYGSQATFVSAGGYHHHIGVNTWAGVGVRPPPPDAVGLRYFEVWLPDQAELERALTRVGRAEHVMEERSDGVLVRDPSQNGVLLTAAPERVAQGTDRGGGRVAG